MEQRVLNRILLLLEWNAASEQNYAACWALMVEPAFLGGRKRPPFAAEWGQHRFPSCSYDAIQKQHKKKKKKKQYFADSCHHWKTNWAVGIKVRDRDYILLQKRNRRGWLKGKDSVIFRLVGMIRSKPWDMPATLPSSIIKEEFSIPSRANSDSGKPGAKR